MLAFAALVVPPGTTQAQEAAIPLGTPMPGQSIELKTTDGATATLASRKGAVYTAVVFWGNKCPWTTRYEDRIKLLANDLQGEGKVLLFVNSNDASAFPAESVEECARYASDKNLAFPYLIDSESELAHAFGATRMPQAFVFDAGGTLVYTGSVDDSPGDPDNVTKQYLRDALAATAASQAVAVPETKAFGCMIRLVQ